jgi:hypothetical protein
MKLLRDDGVGRVYRSDNRRGEEGKPLHRNVVKREDEGCCQYNGVKDPAKCLLLVQSVQNLVLADTLGLEMKVSVMLSQPRLAVSYLDASNSEILLFLRQPPSSFRAVRKREERDDREQACNDSFYSEDHSPTRESAERIEREDC